MPGLRGALTVRISDGYTDRLVTQYARGLKFTKVAPGGHQAISCPIVVPRSTFTDLGPEDRIYVYDGRSGRTIIEGYLENPTPVDGPDGQSYELSAVGGMARVNDETRALIYVDRDLDQFEKANDSANAAQVEAGTWVADASFKRMRTSFPGGEVLATNGVASAGNYVFERAGMNLGGIRVGSENSGKTDANYSEEFVTSSGTVVTRTMNATGVTLQSFVGATNFPTGTQRFALRLIRTGAAVNVADETTWTDWADYSVVGQRMDRYGTLLTGSGGLVSAGQVLASQVVEDLLGRILTFCDANSAQVDSTSFGITQLAYYDGVKAAGVLNDLNVYEPDYLWEILESLDNGRHRFNFRAWPTTPRYEVSVQDGWKQTASDVDLCNRILVSWTDATGKTQSLAVTTDTAIDPSGKSLPISLPVTTRIKDADPITLPEGHGSSSNATRIGQQILYDKANPPKAGTVVVRRPIKDMLTGNTVMPWEIEPGYLCRIRETGDDLPITQVDYDDDSVSMVLQLGRPVLTEEQRLARLAMSPASRGSLSGSIRQT